MFKEINKEYIRSHTFENDSLKFEKEKSYMDFRLKSDETLPGNPGKKENELRKKIVDLVMLRYDNKYSEIYKKCLVTESTLRKYIKGLKSRGITRVILAKLCVGTQLSLKETSELFVLQGYALDPVNNLLDAIIVDAIKCKDNIDIFYEECEKYGLNIF